MSPNSISNYPIKCIGIISICILPGILLASPEIQISSVSGDLSHGQLLYILGSGFGEKAQPGPIVWDDFDMGEDGQPIGTGSSGRYTSSGNIFYSANNPYAGGFCAHSPIRAGSTVLPGIVANLSPLEFKNAFISMKWKIVSTYGDITPHNIKLLKFNSHDPAATYGRPSFNIGNERTYTGFQGIVNYGSPGQLWFGSFPPEAYLNNEWNSLSMWSHMGDPDTPNGFLGREINGDRDQLEDAITYLSDSPHAGFRSFNFCGYLSHDGFDAELFMDSIYADTTLARVELHLDGGVLELQIPISWSDEQIVVECNSGRYPVGAIANLVVFDEFNNPSNQFPVEISQGNEGQYQMPGMPPRPTVGEGTNTLDGGED